MTSPDPATLNDLQAPHAVRLLFDHLPETVWEGGRKPSGERLRSLVQGLTEEAAAPDQARMAALLDTASPERQAAQAELARIVLQQALANPALAPAARAAMAQALQPTMGLDPATGLLVIGMLLATTRIDRDADGGLHVHLGEGAAGILTALRLPELLEKLPAVFKALPDALLKRLI